MAALGLDPFKYLYSRDSLERSMLIKLYNRTMEKKEIHDRNLAAMIAREVSKMFKK
jgi:hypothetical protein